MQWRMFSFLAQNHHFLPFGMLIQPYAKLLCTAKERIHPQFPQAYPHIKRGKMPIFRGL
jgi:hypothetical protein